MRTSRRLRTAIVSAIATVSLVLPGWVSTASADTHIGQISGMHVSAVEHSAFTVALDDVDYATTYRLYASTTKDDLYVANIQADQSNAHTVTAAQPQLTLSNLTYSTAAIYYRVKAYRSSVSYTWSDIAAIGLRPTTPTGVAVHSSTTGGTYLTWSAGAATGFTIAASTSSSMSAGRINFTTRSSLHQFTPVGLVKGTTYHFCVRADNAGTAGAYTCGYTSRIANNSSAVSILTYNILENRFDGTRESGNTVANWTTQRRAKAAALVKGVGPDVVAVQEGADWAAGAQQAAGYRGARQVDSFKTALGTQYILANTEPVPGKPGWSRTGNYILYNSAKIRALTSPAVTCRNTDYKICHYFKLPDSRTAAFQELQVKATGAKFLALSVHLTATDGKAYDTERENEAKALITLASAYAAKLHVPAVYPGDFNSNSAEKHAFDGPDIAMKASGAASALESAQHLTNSQYDSANLYQRTAPAYGLSIDHIYAPAGVAVDKFSVVLDLSEGQFVGAIPSDHNPVMAKVEFPY